MNDLQDKIYKWTDALSGLSFSGKDAENFLQGQLTNDLALLKEGHFQLQCRLDRGGRVQSYFYLLKEKSRFIGLIPKQLKDDLRKDLEKYIIMDDVQIAEVSVAPVMVWGLLPKYDGEGFEGLSANFPARIYLRPQNTETNLKELSFKQLKTAALLGGAPLLDYNVKLNTLVTDTILNLNAVSLRKGCFLGQETVAKIESRRGGAHFPVALKLLSEAPEGGDEYRDLKVSINAKPAGKIIDFVEHKGTSYLILSLIRNHRVQGKIVTLQVGDKELIGEVNYIPLGGEYDRDKYIELLFDEALELFQRDEEERAVELLKFVVELNPEHEDAYESIGVLLGRQERFREGIEFMDKVLQTNPDSVMAHTNKSLFYMRLGMIEEAEEEKAMATVKEFSRLGKDAQKKKAIEEQKKAEETEVQRRYEMFNEVLEIDPEDNLANYGLADIHFQRGQNEKAIPLLKKVIEVNKNYSVAYLLLGKVYLASSERDKAKEIFKKGIEIASSQGDLMPANEMQAKLGGL